MTDLSKQEPFEDFTLGFWEIVKYFYCCHANQDRNRVIQHKNMSKLHNLSWKIGGI